jgi:cytochrome oxidase Cu insertion factor (SCO1/SenC/PrrC family)
MNTQRICVTLILASCLLASCTPGSLPTSGAAAPQFELFDVNGQTVRLSDFNGRPVVLNFWAID